MEKVKILVVDDDKSIRQVLLFMLKDEYDVTILSDGQQAIDRLYEEEFDIILLDIRMPNLNGIQALKLIQKISPKTDVVMVTATMNSDITSQVMKIGAVNYLTKPFDIDKLKAVLAKLVKKRKIVDIDNQIQQKASVSEDLGMIAGNSDAIRSINDFIDIQSGNLSNVLIYGDKGVEHDVLAYSIYEKSNFGNKYNIVNCAGTLDSKLMELLFGKIPDDKDINELISIGLLNVHNKGVLYIRNIDCMSLLIQKRLTQWLSSRNTSNLKLIFSTTKDLEQMINDNLFDEEFYHYINEASVYIPSLDERNEDIPVIISYLVEKYNRHFGKKVQIPDSILDVLYNSTWRGNTLELDNIIKRLILTAKSSEVEVEYVPLDLILSSEMKDNFSELGLENATNVFVRQIVDKLMIEYDQDVETVTNILGISNKKLQEIVSQ